MAKAAKQAEQSAIEEPAIVQPYSEQERLAMVIFTNLATSNITTSKTLGHISAMSFDMADAFFVELESRRLPAQPTAIEFASAAAPSLQGESNGQ